MHFMMSSYPHCVIQSSSGISLLPCSIHGVNAPAPPAGQSIYSLTHSKPRRLQWTWLGHAELRHGAFTLYVSTLQMFILLQFNSQEVSPRSTGQPTPEPGQRKVVQAQENDSYFPCH